MDENNKKVASKLSSKFDQVTLKQDTFGERTLFLREKLGVSQEFLATKVGVSSNTIQSYEKNNLPKGANAIELAKFFGVSLDWLLTGEGPMHRGEASTQSLGELEELRQENRELRKDNRELVAESRELNKENRELMRENGDLRVELERLKARAAPSDAPINDTAQTA